jgi:EAL domain-containing protein (putative c-di-GMP-specific phosphodiesterase class I)
VTDLGVQYAQGFYFSPGVDVAEFDELLRDPHRISTRLGS